MKGIQSTVSALFGHFNTDSTSENRGTNDISDDYLESSGWCIFFCNRLLSVSAGPNSFPVFNICLFSSVTTTAVRVRF